MPLRSDWSGQNCPIARSLDVLGDPWVMLIARDALQGLSRFAEFRDHLGIADNVLSNRLSLMVAAGLLEKVAYRADNRAQTRYLLTEAGADLLPILHALVLWGERHTSGPQEGQRLEFVHRGCGQSSTSADVCSGCGAPLTADNVDWLMPWRQPARRSLAGAPRMADQSVGLTTA